MTLTRSCRWLQITEALRPRNDGDGVELCHSDGVQRATLKRTSGNFAISIIGTDARALYLNALIGQWQLGGTTSAQFFQVSNGVDAPAFKVRGDLLSHFYGSTTWEAGNLLPGTSTQDVGAASARWQSVYSNYLRATSGGISYTEISPNSIKATNTTLQVLGGFGLTFKITNTIGAETIAKFVGNVSTQRQAIRAYYGTGAGTTWIDLAQRGTAGGFVRTGVGILALEPAGNVVRLPTATSDPTLAEARGVWFDSTFDQFRGNKTSVIRSFSMEFPPGSSAPSSGMTAGDRWYHTGQKRWYSYDGGRSKWLSEDVAIIAVGRNGDTIAGDYYRGIDGAILSATTGYPALHNGTAVSLCYTRSDTDSATFEVTAGGSAIAELASTAVAGCSVALDGDFSADDILAVRNKAGGNTTSLVQAWIHLRWRP